jgi:membrane-associated phospholipid phosphatase
VALVVAAAVVVPIAVLGAPQTATGSTAAPDLDPLLAGYNAIWTPADRTTNSLQGRVRDAATARRDDELTVWINQHATEPQRLRALQDAQYHSDAGTYDQSVTISTALGSVLGPLYVAGYQDGELPLTRGLLNSTDGTSGAFVTTGAAKWHYSHPRPFLSVDPTSTGLVDAASPCSPQRTNAVSLAKVRAGQPWADADGNLRIHRVADTVDTTHDFTTQDVPLTAGYDAPTTCTGGSFPSGHTTTAYQAGITLATLLPELAPEILARASEAGNDRIVLGVHYPLDIMGGRIDGEASAAARWSDAAYRRDVLQPARTELVRYLEKECGASLARCIAQQSAYSSDPYGGAAMPGGTAQRVTDRASAVAVFHERLTYGFAPTGPTAAAPSVPAGAAELLRTTFPTLTTAQRTSVLAQTELASGFPLDLTAADGPAWQRLDLAAAMSATVEVHADGSVHVVATGGTASVKKL